MEQSNSKQLLNGNVSVAVNMAAVPGTSSRSNQIKKKSKTKEEGNIVINDVRQDLLYMHVNSIKATPLINHMSIYTLITYRLRMLYFY